MSNTGISVKFIHCLLLMISFFSTALSFAQEETLKDQAKKQYVRPKIAKSDPYAISKILCYNGFHTLIPKQGVLFIPERFKERVLESEAEGAFQVWPKFYRKNQGWIYTLNVTLDEAKGLKPIDSARMDQLKKLGKVVVTVYKHNPISMLKPRKEEDKDLNKK